MISGSDLLSACIGGSSVVPRFRHTVYADVAARAGSIASAQLVIANCTEKAVETVIAPESTPTNPRRVRRPAPARACINDLSSVITRRAASDSDRFQRACPAPNMSSAEAAYPAVASESSFHRIKSSGERMKGERVRDFGREGCWRV